jgi:hypothetical protein
LLLLLDHTLGDAALVGNGIRAKTHHVRRTGDTCSSVYADADAIIATIKSVAQKVRMEASPGFKYAWKPPQVFWKFGETTGGEGKGSMVVVIRVDVGRRHKP